MVEENPFLGPAWVPLVGVIRTLLGSSEKTNFHLTTYGRHYNLSPHTSPYIQAIWVTDDHLQLEASGNLICTPPLSDEQLKEMEFIGWTSPDVSPEEYGTQSHVGENPNFVRYFGPKPNLDEIADFLLTTLTAIYGIRDSDYFNFGEGGIPDRVEALGGLVRLPKHAGNPSGSIFGLNVERK